MRSIPIGYRIENGEAKIDETGAAQIRTLFEAYNSGLALAQAADKAGLSGYHSTIGRMLKNKKYLGDDYYPALIDQETFDKAQLIRYAKAKSLGRIYDHTNEGQEIPEKNKATFRLGKVPQRFRDPYKQAAYAYSLIETEVANGD